MEHEVSAAKKNNEQKKFDAIFTPVLSIVSVPLQFDMLRISP
jgi:hypothetical protein